MRSSHSLYSLCRLTLRARSPLTVGGSQVREEPSCAVNHVVSEALPLSFSLAMMIERCAIRGHLGHFRRLLTTSECRPENIKDLYSPHLLFIPLLSTAALPQHPRSTQLLALFNLHYEVLQQPVCHRRRRCRWNPQCIRRYDWGPGRRRDQCSCRPVVQRGGRHQAAQRS